MNTAKKQTTLILVAGFLVTWLCATGLLLFQVENLATVIRMLLALGLIVLFMEIANNASRYFILSPLCLLGAVTLIFYSLGPALYGIIFPEPLAYFGTRAPRISHENAITFTESRAEILILQFSAFCFLLLSLMVRQDCQRPVKREKATTNVGSPKHLVNILIVLVVGVAILFLINRWTHFGQVFFSSGLGSEFRHALTPLMSVSTTSLAYFAAREKPNLRLLAAFAMTVSLFAMIVSGLAATAVYIAIVTALVFVLRFNPRPRQFLTVIGMTALVLPIAILLTIIPRGEVKEVESIPAVTEYAAAKLTSKLVFRQTTSGHCLNKIYMNSQSAETSNPFYFVIAIVPRILWPEKPVLSRGSEYAENYCGQTGAVKLQHSESITLLGEPLLNGGILGIVAAQITLAVILCLATILGISGQPVRVIFMVALLPWLATFEQHFAEYFGNLIKVILIMSPFFIVLTFLLRRHQTRRTKQSAP